MQLDMGRREDRRHRLKIKKKIEEKSGEVDEWLAKRGIPERLNKEIKVHIMEKVRVEVEEERDVHMDNILYTLPRESQNLIKSCSPLTRLKKVPMLERMDEFDLKEICEHFKPKKYTKDEIIIEAGKQLEMMLFILDGFVVPERGSGDLQQCGAGELYGQIVIHWLLHAHFRKNETVLLATESVRAIGDVEALVLMAGDIKSVLSRFMLLFGGDYDKLKTQLDNHLAHARTLETFAKEEYLHYTAELIGTGAYSAMYKVTPEDGDVIHAVKRYTNNDSQAMTDRRDNEVVILSLINHENVVKLLGHFEGVDDGKAVLVFEYAGRRYYEREMSFQDRMVVALDISAALAYLHSSSEKPTVIHQNVSLEHVLLDECDQEYTAKIAGLGSSRMIPRGQTQVEVAQVVQWDDIYIDPEFIESKILSEKVDVYSFGGVLVELLTGRKAYSSKKIEAEKNLSVLEKDCFAEIVDGAAAMNKEGYFETAKKVADLARRCLRDKGEERPTMEQVHGELEEVTELNMGRREERRHKLKLEKRLKEKSGEVDQWLAQKGIPKGSNEELKLCIMEKVRQHVEQDNDIHLDSIFYTLPLDQLLYPCMLLTRLKKVPMLETMDESDLKAMCDNSKPRKYTNGEIIIRAGKPLEMMLFIVDGLVVPEIGSSNLQLGAGELYGERVIYWLLRTHFPEHDTVLLATESVRATGDVETLVLMASDIKSVLSRFMLHFKGDDDKFRGELDNRLAHVRALENFTPEFLRRSSEVIVRGAHSMVYKVMPIALGALTHVAKRYGATASQERRDNEVAVLSLLNHENVVRLLGRLEKVKDEDVIVFEYGGLRYCKLQITFEERMFVAVDISAALAYLHSCTLNKPSIIHQNVNLDNILLDHRDGNTAKLSGFGSSKMIPRGQTQIEVTQVVQEDGMSGCIDPEFIDSRILSAKVDVYGFGVVLVELLTIRKAYSSDNPEAERNLATFFLSVMEKDCFDEIAAMDKNGSFETSKKVADVAKRCLRIRGRKGRLWNKYTWSSSE